MISPSGSNGSLPVNRKKRDLLKAQHTNVGSSSSVNFAPVPIWVADSAACPWKRARWVKRSVFSTLPSNRTRVDDSNATI
eukprot:scaffold24388_cov96-Isochrysis_galbana.AAC.1